jgi:hypothetical protein
MKYSIHLIASKIARIDCSQAGKSMQDQDSNYFFQHTFSEDLGLALNLLGKSNKNTREASLEEEVC